MSCDTALASFASFSPRHRHVERVAPSVRNSWSSSSIPAPCADVVQAMHSLPAAPGVGREDDPLLAYLLNSWNGFVVGLRSRSIQPRKTRALS